MTCPSSFSADMDSKDGVYIPSGDPRIEVIRLPSHHRRNKQLPFQFKVRVKAGSKLTIPESTKVVVHAGNANNFCRVKNGEARFDKNGEAVFKDLRFDGQSGRGKMYNLTIAIYTDPILILTYENAIKVTADGPRLPRKPKKPDATNSGTNKTPTPNPAVVASTHPVATATPLQQLTAPGTRPQSNSSGCESVADSLPGPVTVAPAVRSINLRSLPLRKRLRVNTSFCSNDSAIGLTADADTSIPSTKTPRLDSPLVCHEPQPAADQTERTTENRSFESSCEASSTPVPSTIIDQLSRLPIDNILQLFPAQKDCDVCQRQLATLQELARYRQEAFKAILAQSVSAIKVVPEATIFGGTHFLAPILSLPSFGTV